MIYHQLSAHPDTVHWGYFDAALPPVLTVSPGDLVAVTTVNGGPEVMPPPPFVVSETLSDIHRTVTKRLPGHLCTGPVAVEGAMVGDVLEIRIQDIRLTDQWGYVYAAPEMGLLRDEVSKRELVHVHIDADQMVAGLPWGQHIPLHPFFGLIGVAPPSGWGRVSTLPPRRNGGNLDNKELVKGSTLFLPIFVDGANFSVGDGHAAQGDGEVCVTAIETGLMGEFQLNVRKDMQIEWPMAETSTHLITMGFATTLEECSRIALNNMIEEIGRRSGLSRSNAYMLCSIAGDLRITQVVNGNSGVHCMMAKHHLLR